MAVQVPPELQTPEVILRAMGSVMAGDTRSQAQKVLDFLLGGNPSERMGGVAPMRIGVMPGRERIASDIIKRGLKEPWFHGTPSIGRILGTGEEVTRYSTDALAEKVFRSIGLATEKETGFSPSKMGAAHGIRLGEPSGVSLTRSPQVASGFGDVLRVGVDIPPSSVGQFVDPEMQRLLREGYTKATTSALEKFNMSPAGFQQWLKQAQSGTGGVAVRDINQAMSDYLRQQGVEGIAYNPRRWAEYEMRVLDPKKAVPLGMVDLGTPGPATMQRYLYGYRGANATLPSIARSEGTGGLLERLRQQYLTAPEFPVRLRDVLGATGAD